MLTLREVGEKIAAAREVKGFWGQVIKGLEYNGKNLVFLFELRSLIQMQNMTFHLSFSILLVRKQTVI